MRLAKSILDFTSLENLEQTLDFPHLQIRVAGVEYRAASSSFKGLTLFLPESGDNPYSIKYELKVHQKENLEAFEKSGLPREITVFFDIPPIQVLTLNVKG